MSSSLDAERLYRLLPSVYRVRDAAQGEPLRALVSLIAREFEALEENIEQLYDDQFIETCDEWVAPYIGDLIGYRPLHGVASRIASPRAEVANTIAYRRRKGTAAMLEQLARDVTEWPARAVEFFEQLTVTQYMNHTRPHSLGTANIRSVRDMLHAGGPFNRVSHTPEMRRPETGSGRYGVPNVGLFLWRLQPFALTNVPLIPDPGDAGGRKFRLNPLGADQELFRLPVSETLISHIAEPENVPGRLRIRELAMSIRDAQDTTDVVAETPDYGAGRSFVLRRAGAVVPINRPGLPVPPGDPPSAAVPDLRIADLRDVVDGGRTVTGWAHEAGILDDEIFLDPQRGRVLLGSARAAEHAADAFFASYHYGGSRPIGGGEYERSPGGGGLATQRTARGGVALQPHLDAIAGGGRLLIGDSLLYSETPVFRVDGVTAGGMPGIEVVVAAANETRPLLAAGAAMNLAIGARGTLILDGLVIVGGALHLAAAGDGEPRELTLRHCTLVPGLRLHPDGSALTPGAPSIVVDDGFAKVTLEHCVVGSLRIIGDAEVRIVESIVDAGADDAIAYEGISAGEPGAELSVCDSTVIGKLHARLLRMASNTIFCSRLAAGDAVWRAPVWVERKQEGCTRFSFVPSGSLVPQRFHCVPDDRHPDVIPHFTSLRYGDAGYAQLRAATDKAIREGADDGGEIGVMHPLYQPQRETNLRIRLDEYLRFGLHAGLFYAT